MRQYIRLDYYCLISSRFLAVHKRVRSRRHGSSIYNDRDISDEGALSRGGHSLIGWILIGLVWPTAASAAAAGANMLPPL